MRLHILNVQNLFECSQKQENLSLVDAINKVEKLYNQEVDNFMQIEQELLNATDNINTNKSILFLD